MSDPDLELDRDLCFIGGSVHKSGSFDGYLIRRVAVLMVICSEEW